MSNIWYLIFVKTGANEYAVYDEIVLKSFFYTPELWSILIVFNLIVHCKSYEALNVPMWLNVFNHRIKQLTAKLKGIATLLAQFRYLYY